MDRERDLDAARQRITVLEAERDAARAVLESLAGELEVARLYEIPGGQKVARTPRWCGLGPAKRQMLLRFIDDMRAVLAAK